MKEGRPRRGLGPCGARPHGEESLAHGQRWGGLVRREEAGDRGGQPKGKSGSEGTRRLWGAHTPGLLKLVPTDGQELT